MQLNREGFENLLREKGLKVTAQRIAVLSALSGEADSHLTAEEIYGLVKVKEPGDRTCYGIQDDPDPAGA